MICPAPVTLDRWRRARRRDGPSNGGSFSARSELNEASTYRPHGVTVREGDGRAHQSALDGREHRAEDLCRVLCAERHREAVVRVADCGPHFVEVLTAVCCGSEPTARSQHAVNLPEPSREVRQVVQNPRGHDAVKRTVGERERRGAAYPRVQRPGLGSDRPFGAKGRPR